jgi:hypothetical protein
LEKLGGLRNIVYGVKTRSFKEMGRDLSHTRLPALEIDFEALKINCFKAMIFSLSSFEIPVLGKI